MRDTGGLLSAPLDVVLDEFLGVLLEHWAVPSSGAGSGSWGGWCLSMGDYVRGTGATKGGRPLLEGANVAYAQTATPQTKC
jgi:hypothetical protein